MRGHFDEQLEQLNVELITMGALCEEAISAATKALLDGDPQMAQQALRADGEIDKKEREIEAMCLRLLLHQQPVAKDLRTISSALKMISDLERIGDMASDITELTSYVSPQAAQQVHIQEMAEATVRMVTGAVESFVQKDLDLARKVMAGDDIVDAAFSRVKNEVIGLITAGDEAETCADLLMVAKYFERIGDHAVNVGEWVEFSITGVHPKDRTPEDEK